MKLVRLCATFAVVWVLFVPAPALACSTLGEPPLEDVLETGYLYQTQVVGFHEQQHIARIPGVPFLVNERSASVVTRYWGEAPNLSVASHGDEGVFLITSTSCGSPAKPSGTVDTVANGDKRLKNPRGSGSNVVTTSHLGATNEEAAAIESRFGPPAEVSLGPDDYVVAYGLLLWRPAVVFGTFGAIAYGLFRRSRRRSPIRSALDRPTLAAAAGAITAVAIATPSYNVVDWFGLLLALAGSVFLGWIMRLPWTAFSVGYSIYFAMRPDPLFVDLYGDDRRLQTAVGAMVIGAGVLVWSRNHWTRYVSSFMVVAGSFFYVLGFAEVRQFTSFRAAIGFGAIVAAATAYGVWWLVFRERRLSSGALAEPRGETAAAGQPPPSQ